jgi:hypothetical protein
MGQKIRDAPSLLFFLKKLITALQVMALLTANALDQPTLSGLRRAGAVTVLVALLANESGAIQVLFFTQQPCSRP